MSKQISNTENYTPYQYFSSPDPNVDELVLVIFNEHTETFIDGELIHYDYKAMMNYQNATKKRKIESWSKIVPLYKPMVACVEHVDVPAKIVQLSIRNLGTTGDDLNPNQIQEKLMKHFDENKIMESFIRTLSITNQYEYEEIWTQLIHLIDQYRRDYNEENDENISLWNYFVNNINDLENWISETELDNEIIPKIRELYEKKTEETIKKIRTRVGIISLGGINQTKNLIKKVLEDLNITYKYTLKYDSTPHFILESTSEDSEQRNHSEFVKKLVEESKQMEPKVFIQVDYEAKLA
jgi:translation initiation factor 2 alpha subunit (eIF-2alpha)